MLRRHNRVSGFMIGAMIAAAVLAGCGGSSGSGSTVTVTPSASGMVSSTPASTTDPKQELQTFLGQFLATRSRAKVAGDEAQHAIDAYNANKTTDQLHKSADDWAHSAKSINDIANQLAEIVPPKALAKPFASYVADVTELANVLQSMGKDGHNGDVDLVIQDAQQLSALHAAARFKVALIQQLVANGMEVPGWVKRFASN
jgi:hypothetical protein